MSNQKTGQTPLPLPRASGPGNRPDDDLCERLRASISRLQGELEERQAEARPMPSSVMRAYQALIDRHFSELAEQDPESDQNSIG